MTIQKFKTSLKCAGCIEQVTPHLNQASGVENWKVDLQHPDSLLTATSDQDREAEVISALESAGYKGEKI